MDNIYKIVFNKINYCRLSFINKKINKIVLALLLLSCWTSIATLPAFCQSDLYRFREFTIRLEKVPPEQYPYTSLIITLDGKGTFQRVTKGDNFELSKTENFQLNSQQIEYLYYKIMRNRFFDLPRQSGDPNQTEKDIIRATVTIDDHTHQVTMYGQKSSGMAQVLKAIMEVLPKKYKDVF